MKHLLTYFIIATLLSAVDKIRVLWEKIWCKRLHTGKIFLLDSISVLWTKRKCMQEHHVPYSCIFLLFPRIKDEYKLNYSLKIKRYDHFLSKYRQSLYFVINKVIKSPVCLLYLLPQQSFGKRFLLLCPKVTGLSWCLLCWRQLWTGHLILWTVRVPRTLIMINNFKTCKVQISK